MGITLQMNKQTITRRSAIMVALSLLFLAACSMNSSQPTATALSRSPSQTQIPTTNISTSPSVATSTAISMTTAPIPTLPVNVAEDQVLELLEKNAGCALPCWWGITPGTTTIADIQAILEPFLGLAISKVRYEFSDSGGHLLMRPLPNGLKVGIQYLARDGIVSMIYISTEVINDAGSIIYGDTEYVKIMSSYTLEGIMSKYGKPDRVMIRSFSYLTAYNQPTRVLLYYPEKGIVAQYLSPNSLRQNGDQIHNLICPVEDVISLRLFDPASGMELAQVLSIDDNFSKYKDIADSTNMDIDTFFNSYQEYDETNFTSVCPPFLETSWELWPDSFSN